MSNVGRPPINKEAMNKRINLRLTQQEYEALTKPFDMSKVSISHIIRKAIKQYVERVDRNEE